VHPVLRQKVEDRDAIGDELQVRRVHRTGRLTSAPTG
jgi:hypothetical protein